jgi:hypothetical protein
MSEPRTAVVPAIIPVGIVLCIVLAIVVLFPIWRCPSCDRATWKKVYPNLRIQLWRDSPAQCEFCKQTGRMSLFHRWSYLKLLQKSGLHPGHPLIPLEGRSL